MFQKVTRITVKKDPVSITTIEEYYAVSASGSEAPATGWTLAVPELTSTLKYLWNYSKIIFSDGNHQDSTPSVIGVYGKGIQTVVDYYLATSASSGVTTSTQGWTTAVQAPSDAKRYLWNYEVVTYTDGTTSSTAPHIIGVYGQKGDPGVSISNVTEYYKVSTANTGVRNTDSGWSTSIPTLTATNKYLWNFELITYSDGDTAMTPAVVIGVYGDQGNQGGTGNGISSITNYYLATTASSGVTTSTSGWTTSVQAPTESKRYLWNYEVVTYTNGQSTVTTPHIIGVYGQKGEDGQDGKDGKDGKDGTGIANVTEYYKVSSSSSGVRNTDSGWSTTIPTLTATNKYLWNFELITYDDGDTLMTPAVIIGVYGDQGPTGNGISSITNYYLASASGSGVTTSTSGWTTAVQAPTEAKRYLWNYEAVTYTNGNTELTTPHVIGVYGEKGNKGDKGDQGDAGPVAPFMGDYDSSQMYYGNAYRTDIVRYSNIYYVARSDAPSSSFSGKTPTNTSYWRQFGQWFKSVATDILFTNIATIENAIIRMLQTADSGKRIVIRNNTMTMYDANGAMKMLISGDTLSDAPSSTSTTLSGQTQLNKTISFPSVRDGWSVTGSGGVTISVTNAANTVRLPSLSCSYTVNPEFTSGELEGLVEFYYLIDGVAYTPVRKDLYWSYGSTKSGSLTLPAQSITLSTGSHTIKVACRITLTGTAADTGTLDYNATSGSGTIYIDYAVQKFELGENGWRVMFASNYLAEFKKVGSALSGVAFLLRTGNYGLQITPSGIKKMTDGTNWVSL